MRDEELEREPAGDAGTENVIEGRNAVIEAFRAGKPIDKLFVLDGAPVSYTHLTLPTKLEV